MKQIYKKPELKQVLLIPEEAVLTGCKAFYPGQNPSKNKASCNRNWMCQIPGS